MHLSESENCSVLSDSLWHHGLYSLWNSPGQNTAVGSLRNPGIKSRSLALQEHSLPAEPPAKPKNTGVGSLSLPDPGIEPGSLALQADSLPTELPGKPTLRGRYFPYWDLIWAPFVRYSLAKIREESSSSVGLHLDEKYEVLVAQAQCYLTL